MGAALTDQIKKNMPDAVVAVGTNSLATSAICCAPVRTLPLRAKTLLWCKLHVGRFATGTPSGIILANALWGDHAENGGGHFRMRVKKIDSRQPLLRKRSGRQDKTLEYVRDAAAMLKNMCGEEYCGDRDVL